MFYVDVRVSEEPVDKYPYKIVFTDFRLMMAAVACAVGNMVLTATDPLLEPELRSSVSMPVVVGVGVVFVVVVVGCR